jgi:hypothetical protein
MSTAIQTTVTRTPALGNPGQEADGSNSEIVSKVAAVDIPFGSYVEINGETCGLPVDTGHVTQIGRGIALLDQSKASGVGYKAGDLVNVMVRGKAIVATEMAVVANTIPFVRFTAPGALGAFRADADTAKAVQPTGMWYRTPTPGAGVAIVEIAAG